MTKLRSDGRRADEIRPITIVRNFTHRAPGSVLITSGETVVLCTAFVAAELPKWKPANSTSGWLTAEYRMLPSSTQPRQPRSDRPDGRATEIQRLIGRSLRAVIDFEKLGPKTIFVDCDVLQADGGTRTTAINGAYLAVVDALRAECGDGPIPLATSVAAMSVGIVDDEPRVDLHYEEDVRAAVDMNVVMTGAGRFIEVQGSGEEATFSQEELSQLLTLARKGIADVERARVAFG
ncbi:MAG: ribonuclease PH [Thermoguttaceae bacterium]